MSSITLKKDRNNCSKCSVFASSALLHLRVVFFTSNSVVFIDRGAHDYSLPRAQGTLITPLLGICQKTHLAKSLKLMSPE